MCVCIWIDRLIENERKRKRGGEGAGGRTRERERGGKHINKFSKFVYNRV